VLDAWFPPAPGVLAALRDHLPWLLRTSPPADCAGMVNTIARVRGVAPDCILAGSGSSDLIFLALPHWLSPRSRVLILDPMYGEYAHVLEHVVGCHVDRFVLSRDENYDINLSRLGRKLAERYDMVILVNPNSPTGRHVSRADLEAVLLEAPSETRIWVDETYVEYAGKDESLEAFSVRRRNVIVCKSMSKAYALSGVRAAYLCASPSLIGPLRAMAPPWSVSLPGQVAAVMALQEPQYYATRYRETHALRTQLANHLCEQTRISVVPGVANFLLCHLSKDDPTAGDIVEWCQRSGLYVRDVGNMGTQLGKRALRIAVKDEETNLATLKIVSRVINRLTDEGPRSHD
jgi:histidinol-phosphate/aromatic aminotransferase/cobyric acid decarboxylase-like protein